MAADPRPVGPAPDDSKPHTLESALAEQRRLEAAIKAYQTPEQRIERERARLYGLARSQAPVQVSIPVESIEAVRAATATENRWVWEDVALLGDGYVLGESPRGLTVWSRTVTG